MTTTHQGPISIEWTNSPQKTATAAELSAKLGAYSLGELPPTFTPCLAAAAAELAEEANIPWRVTIDPAQIALLRLIAKITILAPDTSGPHTATAIQHLDRL